MEKLTVENFIEFNLDRLDSGDFIDTKGSSKNQHELIISYFFGDTINAQIYAYAGVTNPDAITIGLPPIKLLKSNCTIAPAPISIPSEPNYCYYYIGLSLSNRPIGIISANGDTITFSYNCNESEVNGAYTVMINSHFTGTFVRQ